MIETVAIAFKLLAIAGAILFLLGFETGIDALGVAGVFTLSLAFLLCFWTGFAVLL